MSAAVAIDLWPAEAIRAPTSKQEWEDALAPEQRRRLTLLTQCEANPLVRQMAREKARRDPVWFIDSFAWGTDPRRAKRGLDPMTPLVLWPHQEEIVRAAIEWLKVIIDKPRGVGISYIILAIWLWAWLFLPGGINLGISSKDMDSINKENPNRALMGKLLFMLERLPPWLQPEWKYNKGNSTATLLNLTNGNSIVGQTSTTKSFRSDRYLSVFFDEGAFVDHMHLVMMGVLGTTDSVVVGSTPDGPSGWFYNTIHGEGATCEPYTPVADDRTPGAWQHIRITTDDDPRYDDEWEAITRAGMTPDQFEREYGVSYTSTNTEGLIWPEFNSDRHVYTRDGAYTWTDYLRDGGLDDTVIYEIWDPGLQAAVVWLAYSESRQTITVLDYLAFNDRHYEEIVAAVADAGWYCEPSTVIHDKDTCRRGRNGRKPDIRLIDVAASARQAGTQTTWLEELRKRGIDLDPVRTDKVEEGNNRVRMALRYDALHFAPSCADKLDRDVFGDVPTLVECANNYRRKIRTTVAEHVGNEPDPVKDRYSHLADCLRYGVQAIWGSMNDVSRKRYDDALKRWVAVGAAEPTRPEWT